MMNRESIVKALREKGLRITPQRLAVIEVLMERNDDHPGAGSIYREARKKRKDISLSTVYATLGELSRRGIIKTLQFDQMENRYEGNLKEHLNLVCERCGKILDYEVSPVADQREIAKKTGFSVTETRLEYYGYCGDCHAIKKEGKQVKGENA